MNRSRLGVFAVLAFGLTFCVPAFAQDAPQRKEVKRADLSGAPGMEVINSVSEYKPGEEVGLHIHHGIESGYVLQGGMIQAPGKDPIAIPTGAPILNLRDVPHGGFKIVGNQSVKFFTVHIVDKDKPLYDWVKK